MTTQATIQTIATVESLANPIDQLAVLDRQVKDLTAKCKDLKDVIANELGEGKHRGERYGVTVSLYESTTIDYKQLIADLGISADVVAKYAKKSATIRVSPTA